MWTSEGVINEDTITEVVPYSVSFVDLFSASRCRYRLNYHTFILFLSHTNYSNYSHYEISRRPACNCAVSTILMLLSSLRTYFFLQIHTKLYSLSLSLSLTHSVHIKIMYRIYRHNYKVTTYIFIS